MPVVMHCILIAELSLVRTGADASARVRAFRTGCWTDLVAAERLALAVDGADADFAFRRI
jgi:hypothetical protein